MQHTLEETQSDKPNFALRYNFYYICVISVILCMYKADCSGLVAAHLTVV